MHQQPLVLFCYSYFMTPQLIGIAGGSGAGKSTICYKLIDEHPEQFEVINLDDYQKKKTEPNLPMFKDKINWDHPDIIDWDKLINDVKTLLNSKPVVMDVWSHRSNPDYSVHGKMIERIIEPKPQILLEGYLALYNPELNDLYTKKYYLDIDDKTRQARRGKNDVIGDPEYEQTVLAPMHKQFVEPTKNNADEVIDVSKMTVDQVAAAIYGECVALKATSLQ
jgi:uridine kinase